jgi:hypothetical protein
MSDPAVPGGPQVTPVVTPPPMPSIAASALEESKLLVARIRRALTAWVGFR